MSRKKLKASLFLDYILNLVLAGLGFIALSWLFNFSWGSLAYSIIFTVSLFMLMYSKGALAAKIDLRSGSTPLINAIKVSIPLALTLLLITGVYSLFIFNIIPIGNIVLTTTTTEAGETLTFMVKDLSSVIVRILFLNLTGFMKGSLANPLLLLASPLVIVSGACTGYFFGRKKIFLLDVFIKVKDYIIGKFNE